MRILFFQPSLNGHFLEYLHHEYIACCHNKINKFFFVVPESFKEQHLELNWPAFDNVKFVYMSNSEYVACNQSSAIRRSLSQSKIIRRYCKLYKVSHCFLNNLVESMPLLPFFLPRKCKASGILYGIYRWNEDQLSKKKLYFNKFLYRLYSKKNFFKKVYLLNDHESSTLYNKKLSTDVFSYLPDPINIGENYVPKNGIRKSLGISGTDKVYLQLGIQSRKHPFEILAAIKMMTNDELKDKVFIFAGVFEESIKERFLSEITSLNNKARIILKTGRIPFETVYDLFYISDYCFVLYDNSNMSSGVIGYASHFKTYVIGVSHGLLGSLIKRYNLGIGIDNVTSENVYSVIISHGIFSGKKEYIDKNSVKNFCNILMSNFEK